LSSKTHLIDIYLGITMPMKNRSEA